MPTKVYECTGCDDSFVIVKGTECALCAEESQRLDALRADIGRYGAEYCAMRTLMRGSNAMYDSEFVEWYERRGRHL